MKNNLIIPLDSDIGKQLHEASKSQRAIFFAGLPGAGKSLFLQQLTIMAHNEGRRIHLMRWDGVRVAFETPELLLKYPEINGFTDPAIRKAVGVWARKGMADWHNTHSNEKDLLVGELQIVGNRLVELVQPLNDPLEPLLRSSKVKFFVPVPSKNIRKRIEELRTASIANPKHEKETRDAPINVVRTNWKEVYQLAVELGIAKPCSGIPNYEPKIYEATYSHLLQHRNFKILDINTMFPAKKSVYDFDIEIHDLSANTSEVTKAFDTVEEQYTAKTLKKAVKGWGNV